MKNFSLFLGLQLYSASTNRQSIENASSLGSKFNSEFPAFSATMPASAFQHSALPNLSGTISSPMASPRSKATRASLGPHNSELQILQHFIKTNLKLFLKLISSDLQSSEPVLNSAEFNALSMIFNTANDEPMTSIVPYFHSMSTKVPADDLYEIVVNALANIDMTTLPSYLFLNGLSRCVTTKSEEATGKDVRIINCEDSYIYINSSINQLTMINCKDVTIFVAAVAKICTIDKCESCCVSLTCNMVRIGNSIDC